MLIFKRKFNSFPFLGAILLSTILIVLKRPIDKLLFKVFVNPLFSEFDASILTDCAIIVLLVSLTWWTAKECTPKYLLRIISFCFIFYVFQRLNNYWEFKALKIWPEVYYFDLLAVCGLFSVSLCFWFAYRKGKKQSTPVSDGFVEDSTVISYEGDYFKRKIVSENIGALIKRTHNQRSFAIGILGRYGSGKTSFLNLINLSFNEPEVLKISFDPWSASNPEMIRKEFFDLLANEIAAVDRKISSLIYNYGRKLASIDDNSKSWLNWFGFLGNKGSGQGPGEYDQINKMMKNASCKVVVTIDDLDRLYPAEIIEVLKLIRNTANFSNVIYLVGYDREYVQSAVETLNPSASGFLDKIFQLEIPLPQREEDDLLLGLKSQLKEMVSPKHYGVFEEVMIPNDYRGRYENAYRGILRQGRDVVRFLNNFKLAYQLIGEEVDFESLLLLELIKFRFPSIYEMIYTQSDTFLYEMALRSTHEQYFAPRIFKEADLTKRTEEISVFKMHLEKLGIGDEDVSILDGLFMTLFKGRQYSRPEVKNSISYPMYFEIYFRYRLSQKDLSDRAYQEAKRSGDMVKFMQYCANHNLHKELMVRLLQEDIFKNRRGFEQVIMWIFSFAPTFVEKEGKLRFANDALIDKIYNYHRMVTDKLYKKDVEAYKKFIDQLFAIAKPPYLFENELLYNLKKKGEGFVLSLDEMTSHQYSYFTRYAESSHGLNNDVLWIYYGAREHYKIPAEPSAPYKHWRFEPTLSAKMKTYLIDKDPTEFLKFSIEWDIQDSKRAKIRNHVVEMFREPEEYGNLIAANPSLADDIKLEYLAFYYKCGSVSWEKYIDVDFKTELGNRG